jgi:tellurite resistance protein TehA-like permease
MVDRPEPSRRDREPFRPERQNVLTVLSALGWTAVGVLVLVITWPGRWDDTVGKLSAAFGSILALVVIGIQVARVVAVARGSRERGS